MEQLPRKEHPQPQWQRKNWESLNGTWEFAFDFGKSGLERDWQNRAHLDQEILVPFCPESQLSGIGYTDFMPAVWYKRTIQITEEQLQEEVRLHFGAVDYASQVFINGQSVGTHTGGYASFSFDISDYLTVGENSLTVYVEDDNRTGRQAKGKQSSLYYSHGCDYTRTTGIWQTVWLEFLPKKSIKAVKFYPNVAESRVTIDAQVTGRGTLTAQVTYQGNPCGEASVQLSSHGYLDIPLAETHLWEVGKGRLYDVLLTFEEDQVESYFGLREVSLEENKFLLNGQPVFQRLVLDQGFYPEGIYTANDDAMLKRDIELSLAAGFNGARLHEKAFEPRFLYHCDQAGYLVWGEMANWGLDISSYSAIADFLPEWSSLVKRDFNHPAIITWCPFNESWDYENRRQKNELLEMIYETTKSLDPTRPCIDTSGNYHVITDIYDVHDYAQDVDVFKEHFTGEKQTNGVFWDEHDARQTYKGEPFCVSEYGGIKWDPSEQTEKSWGYGETPKTEEEFYARYKGLTEVLLNHPQIFGFCYTQLYDVEQEKNGLYYYDRTPKFDMTRIKEINQQKAKIEEVPES
ncbi:beta-galactosidase [Enterococcus sp. JM4C]|uniref:glycoside hydrolase family 2 protein n=1 Tax=Candidatus Enterococcus huntleyi TaxID=1857217 RepID=UPI00137A7B9F|nr:sugar-binding domain-containing protein [Enterococcus sp. JM4C]KAF1295545.1 beta-galactosidase [Enterococcus sp. JM4C]